MPEAKSFQTLFKNLMNTLLSENVTMGELTGTFPKQIFEKKCEDTQFLNVQFLSRVFFDERNH